jgi:hypothetical protein
VFGSRLDGRLWWEQRWPATGAGGSGIGVQMGVNMGGPIAPESSIRFLSFTVTGGGQATMPDDFGCDSLQPQ